MRPFDSNQSTTGCGPLEVQAQHLCGSAIRVKYRFGYSQVIRDETTLRAVTTLKTAQGFGTLETAEQLQML